MKTYLLDTNVVLRFLVEDAVRDPDPAVDLFRQAASGEARLLVADVVLAECVRVLSSVYASRREKIADVLGAFIRHPAVACDLPQVALDAVAIFAGSPSLDYADCYLAARGLRQDVTVASFDKALHRTRGLWMWPERLPAP